MLTKNDEYTLNAIIEINQHDLVHGCVEDLKVQLERIEWLADRLRTVNDELKKVTDMETI